MRKDLAFFANALRDALDLDPLYQDRTSVKGRRKLDEVRRFYVAPAFCPVRGFDMNGQRMRGGS
jgi:hypothetical protein